MSQVSKKIWDAAHLENHREYQRRYRAAHPERVRESHRRWSDGNPRAAAYLSLKFSIRRQDAELLVALRDGPGAWCDICRTAVGPFVIDHDHETGKIRGILCGSCNLAMRAVDSPTFVGAALEYLYYRIADENRGLTMPPARVNHSRIFHRRRF